MKNEAKKTGKKLNNLRRTIYISVSIIFIVTIMLIGLLILAIPDKAYSETENRSLAQSPNLTATSLADGTFMKDAESYTQDQFPLRDSWIAVKSFADRMLGKREINGVYLGSHNQLIEEPVEPDYTYVDKNLQAMEAFAQKYTDKNVIFALVPNSCLVQSDRLPANAPVYDQNEEIEHVRDMVSDTMQFADLRDILSEHKNEYIFYKTDHHWTSLGAKYAFESMTDELKLDNEKNDYQIVNAADDFYGTLSSKTGFRLEADRVDLYIPDTINKNEVKYYAEYTEQKYRTASIYDADSLNKLDKYAVFMGGNFSRVDIQTSNLNSRRIMVIKDSYANAFLQFLLPYFESIYVIDPRYCYDDINSIIESENITDILFLYNVNTFTEDRNIADFLNS